MTKLGDVFDSAFLLSMLAMLGACQFIPGTKTHSALHARKLAADKLIDPTSAQFRKLAVSGTTICGEVNAKNRMGAYVGFGRFYVDVPAKLAVLDPGFNLEELRLADSLCSSMRSNAYSSATSIDSACTRAGEERLKESLQTLFESGWNSVCTGASPL